MKHSDHSARTQREKLLKWLRKKPITTIEARHELDIIHPPARIYELRKQGYNIQSHWADGDNPGGGRHRVSMYVLFSGRYKRNKNEQ